MCRPCPAGAEVMVSVVTTSAAASSVSSMGCRRNEATLRRHWPECLLRQSENIDSVSAADRVSFWSYANGLGIDPSTPGRDGDVLAAVDRIGDGSASCLRGEPGLPQ